MFANPLARLAKRCPRAFRLLLVPFIALGILGFITNLNLTFFVSNLEVCFPKTNIVFLKTHKCASSSIQNILLRYGYSHNLTFVLPKSGNYLGHPTPFSRSMVAQPLLPRYNILAHHTRLDYREMRALMPENSVFTTILRDPTEVFESSYSYYGLTKAFGGGLHSFLAKAPQIKPETLHKRVNGKFGTNQMMFDLGADPAIFTNETLIGEYIDRLQEWFDLVLLADRMDESLVLLRHLMCWEVDDVVAFKLNARDPKFKSSLNGTEVETLRLLNRADVLLYSRFLDRFERSIDAFGRSRMASELIELRDRTQKWYSFCVKGQQVHRKPSAKPHYYYNPKVMVFETNSEVSNATCDLMTAEELPFTDKVRERQKLPLLRLKDKIVRRRRVPKRKKRS